MLNPKLAMPLLVLGALAGCGLPTPSSRVSPSGHPSATATPRPNATPTATPAPDASLLAYWRFEGNGDDSSGKGNVAALNGVTYGAGQFDQSGIFNGLYSYGTTNFAGVGGGGARTYAAWIKTTSCKQPVCDVITYGGEAGGQRIEWSIENASMGLRVWSDFIVYSAPNINNGAWHFVAVSVPEGATLNQVQMYMDGSLLSTVSSSLRPTTAINSGNSHPVTIGRMYPGANIMGNISYNGSAYFAGSIDELRIYSRALTAGEIKNLKTSNSLTG